jgi:hypothetical protein
MARMEALPEDYRYVFKKIQSHMWMFAAGSGYDMTAAPRAYAASTFSANLIKRARISV